MSLSEKLCVAVHQVSSAARNADVALASFKTFHNETCNSLNRFYGFDLVLWHLTFKDKWIARHNQTGRILQGFKKHMLLLSNAIPGVIDKIEKACDRRDIEMTLERLTSLTKLMGELDATWLTIVSPAGDRADGMKFPWTLE